MSYAAHVWTHLRKDLRLEWRSKDSINGMLFFSLLVVSVFAIAFDPTAFPGISRQISGGLMTVAVRPGRPNAANMMSAILSDISGTGSWTSVLIR